jgi:hypothetical protein
MTSPRRIRIGVTTCLAATLALALPASAHNLGGDLVHYDSKIVAITPAVEGLSITTSTGGEYLNLRNAGPHTVIVEGYKGEPYLKLTRDGAWENARSESTYLNKSLFGDALSEDKDLGDPAHPDWKPVASGGSYKYHDHRIHWMGLDRPPVVKDDPGHDHLIASWKVHLLADGMPVTVLGELRWLAIHPTSVWLWVGPLGGMLALFAVLILIVRQRRRASALGPG